MKERKRNERGFIVPSYSDLLLRMLEAADNHYPSKAAIIGMHFERWVNRQPSSRWAKATDKCDTRSP